MRPRLVLGDSSVSWAVCRRMSAKSYSGHAWPSSPARCGVRTVGDGTGRTEGQPRPFHPARQLHSLQTCSLPPDSGLSKGTDFISGSEWPYSRAQRHWRGVRVIFTRPEPKMGPSEAQHTSRVPPRTMLLDPRRSPMVTAQACLHVLIKHHCLR